MCVWGGGGGGGGGAGRGRGKAGGFVAFNIGQLSGVGLLLFEKKIKINKHESLGLLIFL